MASEDESDHLPMLSSARPRPPKDHTLVELSEFLGSLNPDNNLGHLYFSAPLQPSRSRSRHTGGPSQGSRAGLSSVGEEPAMGKGKYRHQRYYSGPIIVKNDAASASDVAHRPNGSIRRRPQAHNSHEQNLFKSGPLGKCDDEFCTTCPLPPPEAEMEPPPHCHPVDGQATGRPYTKRWWFLTQLYEWGIPGVINPHDRRVRIWNKVFLISCLLAVFVDPLFFFILSINKEYHCIYFNETLALSITILRSLTDVFYITHMLLQFRLAYISSSGTLDSDPTNIVHHYLLGWFSIDLSAVLPLPQIVLSVIIPNAAGIVNSANKIKNFLRVSILIQYIPRMIRFTPLLAGNSPTGFIFETAQENFFINLFLFLLVAHVIGSCWYLFGLQRVNQCLRNACTNATSLACNPKFLDCGRGKRDYIDNASDVDLVLWGKWKTNANATQCFYRNSEVFVFGIYSSAVNLTVSTSLAQKYAYSLFWGFQQISTLAGNQVPSMFIWEVLFVFGIVILGLLLTVLLIGNMQNFLLSLSRRGIDMQLRRHDVQTWMARRRLSPESCRRILEAERVRWDANRGINEEELLKGLPEDIEKEIRRSLCLDLIKKVRVFTFMEPQVLHAICERVRQSLYIRDSIILTKNHRIEKMHFFVKGGVQIEENGIFQEMNIQFCGEELLIWCLEKESQQLNCEWEQRPVPYAVSSMTLRCSETLETFSLTEKDLQEVTRLYCRFLRNNKVQGAIRYESLYWRTRAAKCIQLAWRRRKQFQQLHQGV